MENVIEIQVTTNFVNPSYPGFDSNTGYCSFNLRLHSDVCQVVKIMIIFLRHGEDIHGDDFHYNDSIHEDNDTQWWNTKHIAPIYSYN